MSEVPKNTRLYHCGASWITDEGWILDTFCRWEPFAVYEVKRRATLRDMIHLKAHFLLARSRLLTRPWNFLICKLIKATKTKYEMP